MDRDGVVNVEVDYLHRPEDVILEDGVGEAIRLLRQKGFKIIVVTNQAGVARGMYGEADIKIVHAKIEELLAQAGAKVDAFYYCPHHPDFSGECDCRKPSPRMLLDAAAKFDIDMAQSLMVGDRLSDLEAGFNAGCGQVYLVRTGYGKNVDKSTLPQYTQIATNLLEVAQKI